MSGQLSHASPTPSPSRSSWSRFFTRWQLSRKFFSPDNQHEQTPKMGMTPYQKDKDIFCLNQIIKVLPSVHSLTISIHVVIACISEAIRISVSLVWVIHSDTVVTCIAMAVLITVPLIYIWCQPAVILKSIHIHRGKKFTS